MLERLNTQLQLSSILAATIILEKIFRNTYFGICAVKDWDRLLDIVGVSSSRPPNKNRPKKIWVAKSLVEKVKGPQQVWVPKA